VDAGAVYRSEYSLRTISKHRVPFLSWELLPPQIVVESSAGTFLHLAMLADPRVAKLLEPMRVVVGFHHASPQLEKYARPLVPFAML
jgi:hypothetical protein